MPDESTPLDIAKFHLDAYVKASELRLKSLMTYAEFNLKMMEVAQKQMEVARAGLELEILRDAFQSFKLARKLAARQAKSCQEQVERYAVAIARLPNLVRGETALPFGTADGWRGFWVLSSRAPVSAVLEMGQIRCSAADRKGKAFFSPRNPSASLDDAPSEIRYALALMDWARKKLIVPRLGSKPMTLLAQLLEILGKAAETQKTEAEAELSEAAAELKRIRETAWKNIVVSNETPHPKSVDGGS